MLDKTKSPARALGPRDLFVRRLLQASRKANRFLRRLPRADRDDILAAAMLWCWEHRDDYSLTTTLETWFVNAVRHAYERWRRGELREAAELVEEIPTGDTTLAEAEARDALEALTRALPPEYRRVAELRAQGHSEEDMLLLGISERTMREASARIKQLRRLAPDTHEHQPNAVTPPAVSSDDATDQQSPIDRELEQLDFPPTHGKECPPCWRCLWFDGVLPGERKSVRMQVIEPEVAEAVRAIEARKIEIAAQVRKCR